MAEKFDAIVVGGGSVGVPSALALAERGLSVVVLEKRPAVGQGENKAAIGGVRATHSDPAKILLCSRTLSAVSNWKEERGDDIGWKTGGYCFPVYTESIENTLKSLLPIQHRFGLENSWVDANIISELIPGVSPNELRGGTYSPNDGQVSPLLFIVAMMRAAEKSGAVLKTEEEVSEYLIKSGKIYGVKTNKGEYHAPLVILATGSDAREDGERLGITIPVTPDSHEAGITAPVEAFLKPLVVDLRPGPEGKTANFYFGQNAEGQIIFCYTPKELFVGTERESLSEFLPILAQRMISLVPRLKHLLVRRVWRGCYPMTPDGVPIISNVDEIDGLTLAVGMCGQGFMLSMGVGQEVASLALDKTYLLPEEAHRALVFKRDFYAAKTEALK